MNPRRLDNGRLAIPVRLEGPRGELGDGVMEIGPEHPDYAAWERELPIQLDTAEYSRALDAHRALRLAANTDIHHTGCMVALYPNPDDAEALAADRGGEPADEMHITLAFLGQAANVDEQVLITAVQGWASSVGPIASLISGYGYFTEGPKPVTYWSVDAPRLPAAREALVQALDAAGLPVKTDHGFTPHMTIDYAKRKVDPPKGFTMRFGSVVVAHGDNRTRIPLTSHVDLAINFDESQVRRDLKGRFSRGTRVRLLSGKGRALAAPDADGSVRVKLKVPGSILDLDFRSLNLEGKKLRDLKPGDRVTERSSKRGATVKSVNGQNVKIKTDAYDYEQKVHYSRLAVEDDDITAESVDDVESASVWGVQNGFRLELGDKMNSGAIRDVVMAIDKVLAARPKLRDDIGVILSLSEAAKTPEWDAAAHAIRQADSHHGKLIAQQNPYTRSVNIWINDTAWADDFNQGDAHMQEISDSKRSLGGMVAHELGHVHMLSADATGYVQRAQDLMREKGPEWISEWLSPYANTNAHEAYAEAFAVLHHPDRPIPDEIRRELEKVVTG